MRDDEMNERWVVVTCDCFTYRDNRLDVSFCVASRCIAQESRGCIVLVFWLFLV